MLSLAECAEQDSDDSSSYGLRLRICPIDLGL